MRGDGKLIKPDEDNGDEARDALSSLARILDGGGLSLLGIA
jgi:hypothetical protein